MLKSHIFVYVESNEARKQKTSKKGSPKQRKKVNLGVGPSKKGIKK